MLRSAQSEFGNNFQGQQQQQPQNAHSQQQRPHQPAWQHRTEQQQQQPRSHSQRNFSSVPCWPWTRAPAPAQAHVGNAFQGEMLASEALCAVLQPPKTNVGTVQAVFLLQNYGRASACSATEPLQVTVLGAGQDVGRSAVYVRRGERGLLFDCGSHLGAKQARKLPALNLLLQLAPGLHVGHDAQQTMEDALLQPSPLFSTCTDATVVSHFHMDHCGSLPSFTERLGYRNPIAMTFPTRALSPVLLLDSARIFKEAAFRGRQLQLQEVDGPGRETCLSGGKNGESRLGFAGASQEHWNYTEGEAQRCMRRCVALRLHESWEATGWTTTPYYAGHVLGAAMMYAQLPGGFSIVYTGDFNTAPDRHLGSASIPRLRPDLLISECTYGSFVRPSKRITEREFCDAVHDALKKGGKVLIPVFAVGRAQELCMLLNSYWQRMQLQYPIYFGGGMTEKANKYYKLYVQWTGSDLAHRLDDANSRQHPFADHIEEDPAASDVDIGAFNFSHISTLPPDVLTAPTPMVLLATPGMLHGGLALKALKLWAEGPENLVLLPGFCVRGTIGAMLIDGQRDISVDARTRLKVLCKIRYMSFSAHADTTGIQQLARHLQPKAVMLVHGEKEGMLKLARVLQRELGVPIHTPPTGQTISIPLDLVDRQIAVYVHTDCLRHHWLAAGATATPRSSDEPSWECSDSALFSLIRAPAMQRYLSHPLSHAQMNLRSLGSVQSYFLPPASLLFSLSVASDAMAEPGERRVTRSSVAEWQHGLSGDVHLLMDFISLDQGGSDLTVSGCGSLAHSSGSVLPTRETLSVSSPESMKASGVDTPRDFGEESNGTRAKLRTAHFGFAYATARAHVLPPRCLQLAALRYRHELMIAFPAFQQLLHLFMQYIFQCRQAYEQQRLQSGLAKGVPAISALETPEFCDLGHQLQLRELGSGGVVLVFMSLIAVHDGSERLSIQWAEADERRRGAVSVFVEYFSSVVDARASFNILSKPSITCSA